MIDYRRLIKNALDRAENPDSAMRLRIYQSALQAFENKTSKENIEIFNERQNHLTNAIQLIEQEFTTPHNTSTHEPDIQPASQIPPPPVKSTPRAKQLLQFIIGLNFRVVAGVFLVIAIGVSLFSILLSPDSYSTSNFEGKTVSITSSLTEAETTNLFEADFTTGEGMLSVATGDEETKLVRDGILKATGNRDRYTSKFLGFYGSSLIEINPGKIYSATAFVRYNKDSSVTVRPDVFIGIATFSKDQVELDAKSGDHRYFVINGQPPVRATPDSDGWYKISGQITGIGNHTHMTFRPGSAYARPVVLVSTKPQKSSVELKSFTFGEIN